MFHLGGRDFPTNRDQLMSALSTSLHQLLTLPEERPVVILEGDYPAFERLRIDLTGAKVDDRKRPPNPIGIGQKQPGPTAQRFEVLGQPIRYQDASLNFQLTAQEVRFDYDHGKEGGLLLLLGGAKEGRVQAEMDHKDIESLLLAGAKAAAAEKGVVVEKTELRFTQLDNRSFGVALRFTAKKKMIVWVTAVIRVQGRLDVDDELYAKTSGLTCEGDGVVGSLACGLIRPHLEKLNGQGISLQAIPLGEARLREMQIQVNGSLKVTGSFGS